jgi:hypothetical protein
MNMSTLSIQSPSFERSSNLMNLEIPENSAQEDFDKPQEVFRNTMKRKESDELVNTPSLPLKVQKAVEIPNEPEISPLLLIEENLFVQSRSLITGACFHTPFHERSELDPFIPSEQQILCNFCFHRDLSYQEKITTSFKIIRRLRHALTLNDQKSLSVDELASFLPENLKRPTFNLPIAEDHRNYEFKDIYVLGLILKTLFITNNKVEEVDEQLARLIEGITDKFPQIIFQSSLINYLDTTEAIFAKITTNNPQKNLSSTSSSSNISKKEQSSHNNFQYDAFPWKPGETYVLTNVCKFIPIKKRLVLINGIASRILDPNTEWGSANTHFYSPQNIGIMHTLEYQLQACSIQDVDFFANDLCCLADIALTQDIKTQKFDSIKKLLVATFPDIDPKASSLEQSIVKLISVLSVPETAAALSTAAVRYEIQKLIS